VVERLMLLVSTTALYCIGDDFIRDGVMRLCGVGDEPTVWLNKSEMKYRGKHHITYWIDGEMPPTAGLVEDARAVVIAGTPAWLDRAANVYDHCLESGTPLWIIGAGKVQEKVDLLARANEAGLVHVATARDIPARDTMAAADIEAPIFYDPAFHADYPVGVEKTVDLAVCYKTDKHPKARDAEGAHREIAAHYGDRIEAVFVHSPCEIRPAREIYGIEPYFHHDYRRYLPRYAACRCIIAGRLHAAIPVLATGGSAHVIYASQKREMLQRLEDELPVRVYDPAAWRQIDVDAEWEVTGALERIRADFAAHAAYVRSLTRW